jgi:hypothetical protein
MVTFGVFAEQNMVHVLSIISTKVKEVAIWEKG